MKRFPRVGSLVLVRWDDAYGDDSGFPREPGEKWITRAAVKGPTWPDGCPCETVGWVVRRTSKSLYVAQERMARSHASIGGFRGLTRIPIRMIDSVVRIA